MILRRKHANNSLPRILHCALLAVLVAAGEICFSMAIKVRAEPVQSSAETVKIPPIAFASRIIGNEERTRLIVDFDTKVEHEAYLLDHPKRLIIDLPETFFSIDEDVPDNAAALITNLRFGKSAVDQSRMILRLSAPVRIENNLLKPVEAENRQRLIVDLVKSNEKDFAVAVRKGFPEHVVENADADSDKIKRFKIVIDPGHGGYDGGAIGSHLNTVEKDITLRFSRRLRDLLQKNPAFLVILTRDADKFVGLEERVEKARNNNADLMISVHADKLKQSDIRGATVYTLSEEGSDALSRSLAHEQNRVDMIAGLKLPEANPNVSNILIDMIRSETEVFSERFAQMMVDRMQDKVRLIRNPHRWADFFVLKAPEVPSILLELGYLSNKEDEELMVSDQWQSMLAEQVAGAITDFFSRRTAQAQ